ncbi:hypothetical protein QTP86_013194 [Hemibagrus guttatus]|nr:hypothetical protein QTP86_013194 [Hemibagrus guttatus]
MKSFERLMLSYLKDITDPLLDPLQFTYRANRSVDNAVNMALHFILQHLDSPGSYARILFVDFSSAFNTIIPALLRDKLFQLNVPDSMCSWITDFLTDRRQFVRLGTHVSDLQHISTGSPQGCVLSPLLFSLYTNGCTSGHQSVKLLKFAADTTLIGLISDGDESAYRGEIDRLVSWCSTNNLELNSLKTVEMTVDFRKNPAPLPPVILCDSPVSSAASFCFLSTTITKELKWEQNIRSLTKKAQQRMYFLRQLKKFLLPVKMLVNFYTAIIESILTSSITVWFAAATARDKAKLQRVIHSAEKVIGCSLPSLQELYVSRSRRRAAKMAADPSHPGNELFRSLPSGKRLRSIRTRTSRHKNSFFPTAKKSKLDTDLISYRTLLSKFSLDVTSAKTSFYKEKLETSAQDPRKLHNIFLSLLNPPAPPSPSSLTAEDFATFYTEKIERICQTFTSLPTPPTSHSQHSATPSLTQLSTVASEEVLQITRSCNPTTCPLDPIPSAMLQTISPDLLPFITTVINGSLTSGHVPTAFKKARVIPILKKPALDPSLISNYRPVSLLSFLSKILERVICNQLSDYLMQNNLHDPNQSGFKAAHSTETALLAVTEKLHAARSAKLSSVLILLELSAAFDTVNHKTLLSTLRSLGICGTA